MSYPNLHKEDGNLDENAVVSTALKLSEAPAGEADIGQATVLANGIFKVLATQPASKVMELIERHG